MNFALMPIAKQLLDIALPPRCPGCGIVQMQDDVLCCDCWEAVTFISAPQCDCCGLPFEIEAVSSSRCGNCLSYPPTFDKARAVFSYDDASKRLVLNLKHGDRLDMINAFSRWMLRVGADFFENDPIIIPVPLHKRRLFKRRFNQAGEIAKHLGKISKTKVELRLLKRVKNTKTQGHFSAAKRRRNVTGAFTIEPVDQKLIKAKTIILLDDVMTTGATVEACSKTLKRFGAKQVYVLCLAHVSKSFVSKSFAPNL